MRDQSGFVFGRVMYEIMRYWDKDRTDWDAEDHEFAGVWRRQRKWVVSRPLKSVGPNATLIERDIEAAIRGLKAAAQYAVEPWILPTPCTHHSGHRRRHVTARLS